MKHICAKHKIVYSDRCPKCAKQKNEVYDRFERDRELARFYHSAAWKKVRDSVLKAEPLCKMCGKPAQMVDHIVTIKDGGERLDPKNLQPLCHACHNAKTHAERRGRS